MSRVCLTLLLCLALVGCSADRTSPPDAGSSSRPTPGSGGGLESPGARSGHHLVYDVGAERVLLADGAPSEAAGAPQPVWAWDGDQWTTVGDPGPTPRDMAGAVWEDARGSLLLTGGRSGDEPLHDQWTWDGREWQEVGAAPGDVSNHLAMAYDPAREVTVLFGGQGDDGSALRDTWEWNGRRWSLVASDGPGPRAHAAFAWDGDRERLLLYGGTDPARDYASRPDLWSWDGRTWQRERTSRSPGARAGAFLVWESHRHRMLLVGGGEGRVNDGQTWALEGERWRRLRVEGPGARGYGGIAYDASRRVVVLHGGYDGTTDLGDTWEFADDAWVQVAAVG